MGTITGDERYRVEPAVDLTEQEARDSIEALRKLCSRVGKYTAQQNIHQIEAAKCPKCGCAGFLVDRQRAYITNLETAQSRHPAFLGEQVRGFRPQPVLDGWKCAVHGEFYGIMMRRPG